jgi:tetratricopeptide (TPR) repeat protein
MKKAIALNPHFPGADYNLGIMLQALHRYNEAIDHFRRALALKPDDFELHSNLGVALKAAGHAQDAIQHYRRALALKPDYAEAHFNLGNALQSLDRDDEATGSYERAVALKPELLGKVYINLGHSLAKLGRHEEAFQRYAAAAARDPVCVEAHVGMGDALSALTRHQEALPHYEKALALDPRSAEAAMKLGNAFHALNRCEEAVQSLSAAISLKPDYLEAHYNLGNALLSLDRYADAIQCYRKAIAINSNYAPVYMNLGRALEAVDRVDEALESYRLAGKHGPEFADISKWHECLVHLSHGRFALGWESYEYRWVAAKDGQPRKYSQPRWDGGEVDGVLLAWGEQGLGDQILHAGMAAELCARARSLVLEVEPRLVPLFGRSFPGIKVVALGENPYGGHVDAQTPIGSLGKYFRPSWESFPRRASGYLVADGARTAELRQRLKCDQRIVIGLSWKSQNAMLGKSKSARLRDFEPVLRNPRCRFVNLQYGDTRAERDAVAREFGVDVEQVDGIDVTNDIDALAALIAACDLVVNVSNTSAHLAGALGKPVWILVPRGNARLWYWFKDRADSPWYPTARLFRQQAIGDWGSVVAEVTGALENAVESGQ